MYLQGKDYIKLMPGKEYYDIGIWFGSIFWTMRISFGDFNIVDAAAFLSEFDSMIFQFCFCLCVYMTCILLLNFIVAEASASYSVVTNTLNSVIWKEKAALINESEEMMPSLFKTDE